MFETDADDAKSIVEWNATKQMRLQQVLTRAMQGELARERPLKYWENLKLKPQHMQMLLMRAAGFSNKAIAEQLDYTESRVSVVLNHPDAQSLLAILVSYAAEDVLDIKTRIKAHAGEALDAVLDTMRTTKKDEVRANVGFNLLKMAGYGAIERKEVTHQLNLPQQQAKLLTDALRESADAVEEDFEQYLETIEEAEVEVVEEAQPPEEEPKQLPPGTPQLRSA